MAKEFVLYKQSVINAINDAGYYSADLPLIIDNYKDQINTSINPRIYTITSGELVISLSCIDGSTLDFRIPRSAYIGTPNIVSEIFGDASDILSLHIDDGSAKTAEIVRVIYFCRYIASVFRNSTSTDNPKDAAAQIAKYILLSFVSKPDDVEDVNQFIKSTVFAKNCISNIANKIKAKQNEVIDVLYKRILKKLNNDVSVIDTNYEFIFNSETKQIIVFLKDNKFIEISAADLKEEK